MQTRFLTRQAEIVKVKEQINEARRLDNWRSEYDLQYFLNLLEQEQKLDIKQNWSGFIRLWFSTKNISQRLELCKDSGIVQTKLDNQQKIRFVTQKHSVRAPLTRAKELRFWTYWRDDAQCAYCNQKLDKSIGQIDHVIPVTAWPAEFMFLAEDISNLVASCRTCNQKKLNFLDLPDKEMMHVEIDTCLPKRSSFLEKCINENEQDCVICEMPSIEVLCNTHGLVKMQICSLTALKNYLGHK